jgi:enterobacterial common antigen flippase
VLIYVIVRRLTGFRWSSANLRTAFLFLPLVAIVFTAFFVLPVWLATTIGTVAVVASSVYSLRMVCKLVSLERMPRAIRGALVWFKISNVEAIPPAFGAPNEI